VYKLIIFDLDGVLIDTKEIHFNALNKAIELVAGEEYRITNSEHISLYDGFKTQQKLNLLTEKKFLPEFYHKDIWSRKQSFTLELLSHIKTDDRLVSIFTALRNKGYKLACCSNSIRRSVLVMLSKIGLIEYMDLIISNEDVKFNFRKNFEQIGRC